MRIVQASAVEALYRIGRGVIGGETDAKSGKNANQQQSLPESLCISQINSIWVGLGEKSLALSAALSLRLFKFHGYLVF